jgi:hypothetical protein
MKALNLFFQWFFWMFGIAGLALGVAIAITGSWTRGITASMVSFGTMVPLGNVFRNRRQLARLASTPR